MSKAYRTNRMHKTTLNGLTVQQGETIEQKIERIVENKEPIKDGAPEIFTERKDGVIAAYNIRTDRFEIAAEAMDLVSRNIAAKREEKAKAAETKEDTSKVVNLNNENKGNNGGTESIQGKNGGE